MMQTPPFALYSPDSVESALDLVREFQERGEEFDWISGGTDLLPNYKWHLNTKPHVISLAKIEELHTLSATHIGAMVRLHDLSNNNSTHPLVRKAASSVASVMIRRSATVGGNICLDTRCFWFNQSEDWRESIDWCYKCDCGTGSDCRVISNQNTLCVATYQADLAPNLMCLGAKIHLASPDGKREMDLSEFFELDGIKRNVLQPSEFVTHITLPNNSIDFDGDYLKLTQRESWDFPEVGIAVAWKLENNKISELRLASTGLESIPRLHSEEGQTALLDWNGEESVNGLSEAIRKAIKPVNNTQFQPSYRRKMVRILTQRCLKSLKDLSAAD
jgi:4-hydroxybenzoyl-CoA reductase subunit beta